MEKDILIELKDGLERLLGTGRARLILYGSRKLVYYISNRKEFMFLKI